MNLAPGATNEGKVWIAGARVLNENNEAEERLFSKALQEVVETFRPFGIRIFNLSVNIFNRRWSADAKRTVPRRSWIARRIDHLSREHDIIFVISTGNIIPVDVHRFIRDGHAYPRYFTQKDACILDPGQAALALTIGSVAPGTLTAGQVGRARALAEQDHASPFTRSGPGIRKDVKPELVDYGGNYLLDEEGGIVRQNKGLSVPMASNKLTPAVAYDAGTSFAAPRASHKLALIQHDLAALGIPNPSSALMKAFLVNSARYPIDGEDLDGFIASLAAEEKNQWVNVLGYGLADSQRATYCDEHSAVLFYEGSIEPGKIIFIEVPVPAVLTETARREEKRLTVTVVHTPEVQRWGLEEYLGTVLKWRMFRGDLPQDQVIAEMSAEESGTVADGEDATEDDELRDLKFTLGVTLRSRGTIQHDVAIWKEHRAEFSENHYTLAIGAYERWGRATPTELPFAVVVRLEDKSNTAQVYAEVQAALVALEVRANAHT